MNDQELRALVRASVERHLAALGTPSLTRPLATAAGASPAPGAHHPSHAQYVTLVNLGDACLIESSVACNHCGYCKCHGH